MTKLICHLRMTAVAADVAKGLTELQLIETFMVQSGFWDYELDGHEGYYDGEEL